MYLGAHLLGCRPQPCTELSPDPAGVIPGGKRAGAVSLESPCLWIPPSFISHQSTSSSFRAKLQAYYIFFFLLVWSLSSLCCAFITRLCLVVTLALVLFHLLDTNALIWVWFAGREGSGIIIFFKHTLIYFFQWVVLIFF